jgi:cytoskeletal protein RodZ
MSNPLEHAEQTVTGWLHHHNNTEESSMTDTAISPAASDSGSAPPPSFWGLLHVNLTNFTAAMTRFIPHLEQIAANPRLDAAVEALLNAAGMGVEAEVFEFVTGALNNAAARKAAAAAPASPGEQPAPTI